MTLDDPTALAAARRDPVAFVDRHEGGVIFDEVQRAPELFLPIKAAVDRDRRPGRFLLTGSANVLLAPAAAEALAGRMEALTLWPFSAAELEGRPGGRFIDWLFARSPELPTPKPSTGAERVSRLITGGFPEAVERKDDERRRRHRPLHGRPRGALWRAPCGLARRTALRRQPEPRPRLCAGCSGYLLRR